MKPKHFPRLWCALAGLLPLHSASLTGGSRQKPDSGEGEKRLASSGKASASLLKLQASPTEPLFGANTS